MQREEKEREQVYALTRTLRVGWGRGRTGAQRPGSKWGSQRVLGLGQGAMERVGDEGLRRWDEQILGDFKPQEGRTRSALATTVSPLPSPGKYLVIFSSFFGRGKGSKICII